VTVVETAPAGVPDEEEDGDGWDAIAHVADPAERAEIVRGIKRKLVRAARPDETLVERFGEWIFSTIDLERMRRQKTRS
jgi:hypothetical protein